MPYAEESIKYYKNLGLTLGIVTGSPLRSINNFFEKKPYRDYFTFVVSRDDVEYRKPHPESYLQAIAKSNCELSEIIVFEDTQNGVLAAKEAGLTCFAVQSDKKLHFKLDAADLIFDDLNKVKTYVSSHYFMN